MFAKNTKAAITLSGSPSFVQNNLSAVNTSTLAYVRLNEVVLVRIDQETKRIPVSKCKVFQTKFVEVDKTPVLAILSDIGFQLWSVNSGEHMVFNYNLSSTLGSEGEDSRFMCGVASHGNQLFTGCSTGNILSFDTSNGLTKSNFPLSHCLETTTAGANRHPILTLSSGSKILAAGNDFGQIFLYNMDSALEFIVRFEHNQTPVTSLIQTDEVLIAGYYDGRIRLYRLDIYELYVEITAHARPVTGLAMDFACEYFTSCSADQYVHVWTVPSFSSKSSSTVGCVSSEFLDSSLCTGVAFLDDNRIAVANYDEESLVVLSRT